MTVCDNGQDKALKSLVKSHCLCHLSALATQPVVSDICLTHFTQHVSFEMALVGPTTNVKALSE